MHIPLKETPWEGAFPDIDNWSENFCLAGFDPQSGVGLWFHIGRWHHDLNLFREVVIIRLPDNTVIAHRAIGNAHAAEDGPGGPHLAVQIAEPGRKLTYRFNGGVMRVPAAQMLDGLVGDGRRTPVSFDLTFTSTAEIWDLHKVGALQEFLPAGHVEQPGLLSGSIRVGSEQFSFNAMANRDHSLGGRDNRNLHSHQWFQGYFENGLSFLLFDAEIDQGEQVVFSEAVIYEDGKSFEAKIEQIERCNHVDDDQKLIRTVLSYENGTLVIDTAGFHGSSYLSLASPNDTYVGVYPTDPGPTRVVDEQSVSLLLNGTVKGYGCYERTIPGAHIREV